MGEKGGDKVEPKVIKKTQDTLGKLIKKPPLTEKLLGKPPFRFLHDIFTSVIKSTGFMKGLFTEGEMNSENVKDKESKMQFLQKAIDMVSLVIGKPVAAKPSRIVAGLEPDRTNEFLQCLAEAVNKKVNNDEYVERILKGGDSKPPSASAKKERDQSSDKRKRDEKKRSREDGDRREKSHDRERSSDKDRDRKHREKSHDRRREKSRDGGDADRDRHRDRGDKDKERRKRKEEREEDQAEGASPDSGVMNGEAADDTAQPEQEPPARIPRPTSAKGSRRRHGHGRKKPDESQDDEEEQQRQEQQRRERERSARMNGNVGEDDIPPQVAAARRMPRPSSARPAAPRVKKNEPEPNEAIIMGSSNVPNLIVDKKDDSDSEEETFVTNKEEDDLMTPADEPMRPKVEDDEDHGGLVKKMLETKKELEAGNQASPVAKKTEIERSHMSDATKRKEREMVQRDINKLRSSIQTLTRSVNPLGKILDFVQEDLDSMQKELDVWKRENKQNAIALQREQSITESSIEPLKAQLGELEQEIRDKLDSIAALKANIHKNNDKMQKMLGTVTKS